MTLLYEEPVIDLARLKRTGTLSLRSHAGSRVGILISPAAIEKYIKVKADQARKKYNRLSIKFAPPYVECLFDVPTSEIHPETTELLGKFVKGGRLEGYAAFQIRAKDNSLYASSSKVIVNHFLVPGMIIDPLQAKFNPFDTIPVLHPFQYSINHVTVQNQYLYLAD